jgi:hypothetical protein
MLERLRRLVRPGGLLVLAGEPVGDFEMPWGVRLDGQSLYAMRKHGWLELGFETSYLGAEAMAQQFGSRGGRDRCEAGRLSGGAALLRSAPQVRRARGTLRASLVRAKFVRCADGLRGARGVATRMRLGRGVAVPQGVIPGGAVGVGRLEPRATPSFRAYRRQCRTFTFSRRSFSVNPMG